MALTRAALKSFLEDRTPFIEEIIGSFNDIPALYERILNMKSTANGWVDINTATGVGLWAEKDELQDAHLDQPMEGPTARATVVTYAKRTRVSREAISDDLGDGIISNRLPDIMKKGRYTQEVLAHDILNSGFAAITTPDSAYLFSDAHVLIGGGTGDNLTTGALTQTTLQAAITLLQNQVDDRGFPTLQRATKLVVGPALQWTAQVILNSALIPTSAFNAINPMATQNIELVVDHYLTSDTAWFLLGDSHQLNWYWREKPTSWSEVDNAKGAVDVGASFRSAISAADWRGVVGSLGT